MSNYKPWKALERRHAKRMGGKRLWRPDFSESIPDGESDTDTWDCKAWAKQRIVTVFRECERKYREFTGERHFHLCLFDPTQPRVGDLVVCRADRYADLEKKEELLDNFLAEFRSFREETDEERAERVRQRADEARPHVSLTVGQAKTLAAAQARSL